MYQKQFFVYILASKRNGTLYIGVTNNLLRRVLEHKSDKVKGFTKKYKVHMLVYYEQGGYVIGSLDREKQLKKWNRKWKLDLIEEMNPEWKDLYYELGGRMIFTGSRVKPGMTKEEQYYA